MTSYIGKKIARKAFAGQAAGLEPADPHYEVSSLPLVSSRREVQQ